ncbi:MAG: hypothetical protein AB1697_04930 [Pseudomonadota bacterium]
MTESKAKTKSSPEQKLQKLLEKQNSLNEQIKRMRRLEEERKKKAEQERRQKIMDVMEQVGLFKMPEAKLIEKLKSLA